MAIVVPKGSHGACREQIVLDARSVVLAPAGKTHAQAATLPRNGLTARLSLDLLKLSPGQVLAVTGAAGAYGRYVIRLAKAEGLTVIADASEKDEQLVASLGADIVVRRGDDVASRFASTSRGAWMASPTGRCSTSASSWTCAMPAPSPPSRASRAIRSATSAPRPPSCAPMRRRGEKLDQLRGQVETGQLTLRVAEIYPPESAADAHRRLEAGGTRGRLIIAF